MHRNYWINDGNTTHGAHHTCRPTPGDTYTALCGEVITDASPGLTSRICASCDSTLQAMLKHPAPQPTPLGDRHLVAI